MNKVRNERERGKKYLILAIIVLTSISGGCAAMQPPLPISTKISRFRTEECKDEAAAVIVSYDYINQVEKEAGKPAYEGEKKLTNMRDRNIPITFTHIDHHEIAATHTTAVEMPAGKHMIKFQTTEWNHKGIPGSRYESVKPLQPEIEITAQPHEVYLLIPGITIGAGSPQEDLEKIIEISQVAVITATHITFKPLLIKTEYVYDQRTGWAHHPTDSTWSFKVKK